MERLTETDLSHLVQYGELPRRTFWNSFFGRLIRWGVFIPAIYIALFLLQMVIFAVIGMISGWFSGKIEFNFGMLVLAVVAAIIALSFGFQFILASCWAFSFIPHYFCRVVAPNPRLAAPIFGTIYVLGMGLTITESIGEKQWWVLAYYLLTATAVVVGTKSAYQSAI